MAANRLALVDTGGKEQSDIDDGGGDIGEGWWLPIPPRGDSVRESREASLREAL